MPTWPTMMQCGPIFTLWATCTRLSILVPRPMTGGAELGAVDADARADLDVVLDDDRADLRDLHVLFAVPGVAEAVGAQDGAGVDDDAVADGDALADDDVGEELAVVADSDIVADDDAGMQRAAGAKSGRCGR